jgi:FkbM family methyltransferase
MARICILTPGQIGTNPRTVKEADALHEAGHEVEVIATRMLDHVEPRDQALMRRIRWRLHRIELRHRLRWPLLRFGQLAARRAFLATGIGPSADLAYRAYAWPLRRAALATLADLYIAHYPDALPAAAAAARKYGARFAYDAEDFHLGDRPDDPDYDLERRLVHAIEARYLPGCAYVTAASPGIADAYARAYGIERPRVLLNTFPLAHAAPAATLRGTVRPGPSIYWFSQTIGPDRGIECAVRAIGLARSKPHLYLRGTPAPAYAGRLTNLAHEAGAAERVHLLPADEPDKMELLAAAYDAGLCSEPAGTQNNAIALSNKLFTYLLAGILPLLSDTPAQSRFAAEAGLTDLVYERENPVALATLLDLHLGEPSRLAAGRVRSWRLGQDRYNWEREQGGLVAAVQHATLLGARCPRRAGHGDGRSSPPQFARGLGQMSLLNRLRKFRDSSRVLQALHSVFREPYYEILCLLYRRGVEVKLRQHRIRLHPRLLGIRPGEYESELSRALDQRVAPGMTVIDIGAHVGLHSLQLSRRVGEKGRIIAVEPSPANASLLRKHLDWNACRNVTVVEAAIGERPGAIEFTFRPDPTDHGGFANSIAYDIGGSKTWVKVTTIDEVCSDQCPDVIKIDVEGAEVLAVRGAREVLCRSAPAVFIAVHPDAMRMLGTAPAELVALLGELGYVGRRLNGSVATEPVFEEILFEKEARSLGVQVRRGEEVAARSDRNPKLT